MCSIISKHTYFLLKVDLHCNLPHFRNVSNTSAPEHSSLLEKPELIILTTPRLGPKQAVLVIAFRIALKLDVKIVWFGCQVAACVNKRHTNAIFRCSQFKNFIK